MDINSELSKIFAAASPITRGARQREIEGAIMRLSPDYMEASEILAAIHASLRARYDDLLGAELEHDFKSLTEQLEEADATQHRELDIMDLAKRGMDIDS